MDVETWLLAGDPAIRWQTMRDLLDAPEHAWAAERSRVAREGWGARLLALQQDDGSWAGGAFAPAGFTAELWKSEGQPWVGTFDTLLQLRDLGADSADARVAAAVAAVAAGPRWDEGGQAFFDGETEPCINGRVVGLGAYFGQDVAGVVARLLAERLPDGGWNCEAPHSSSVTSFDTTINVVEGLAAYARLVESTPELDAAVAGAEEYLIARGGYRGLRSGEPADPDFVNFHYPYRWHHDVLRLLDYLRGAGREPDPRLGDAIEMVRDRRSADGTWAVEAPYRGRVHFAIEGAEGEPSRWNTLRALRVLRWADG